jgi:hypothetical protein
MDFPIEFKASIYNSNSTYCYAYLNDSQYKTSGETIYIMRLVFFGLFVLSVVGLMFISQTIFYNKNLQAHPQRLIAYICVSEAAMSYNALIQVLNPVYIACYLGLEQIFSYTAVVGDESMSQKGLTCSLNTLCNSNGVFFQSFQLLSLSLNICLCVDLILTLWSPFTPASNRAKFYYMGSVAATLVMMIYIGISNAIYAHNAGSKHCYDCLDHYDSSYSSGTVGTMMVSKGNIILAVALSIYIIIAFYSTIFAYRRLNRPGVSKTVRQLFVKKHFLYVIVFIFIWTI